MTTSTFILLAHVFSSDFAVVPTNPVFYLVDSTKVHSLMWKSDFDPNYLDSGIQHDNVAPLDGDAIAPIVSRAKYPDDGHPVGIISRKPVSFFENLQQQIDEDDNVARCRRYQGFFNTTKPQNRRIFYGGLIANEPWELFEIIAAETYGLFEGMVFVESNRTQNFTPRRFQRLNHTDTFRTLFGLDKVSVVAHVNENRYTHFDRQDNYLAREHEQRAEIVKVWKEMGMTGSDIGVLVDMDETFSRDFLRACQVCDGIAALHYESHHCEHSKVKLVAVTHTFETSPECITKGRHGFHPDMILGACVEGIGDTTKHAIAPRQPKSFLRTAGLGLPNCDWSKEAEYAQNHSYPLWDMSDYRRTCGGYMLHLNSSADGSQDKYAEYTAFHLHNFFTDLNATRFKMKTYGHPVQNAESLPLRSLSNDLEMMHNCALNIPDAPEQKWKRVEGGFRKVKPFLPIYFYDEVYRQQRHALVKYMVEEDNMYISRLRQAQESTQ